LFHICFMAYKNKKIINPRTGQEIRFLLTAADTGGSLLEMESTYHLHSKEPAPHYHPFQAEDFTVISGEITIRTREGLKVLRQGDALHIPANTVHSMWNNFPGVTVVNWKVQPAMETEQLLENIFGLAKDGKVGENGMPGIFQLALTADTYSNVLRLAKPPFLLQKILFSVLGTLASLWGYKPSYRKYIS
jgi:quercetin dioxygenase-like cupin family protein